MLQLSPSNGLVVVSVVVRETDLLGRGQNSKSLCRSL